MMDTTSPQPHEEPQSTQSAARLRRRTRIACDKCSSSRVRCDGKSPCRRCQEYGHECQYHRDLKKRGRKVAVGKSRPEVNVNNNTSRQSSIVGFSPRASTETVALAHESHQHIIAIDQSDRNKVSPSQEPHGSETDYHNPLNGQRAQPVQPFPTNDTSSSFATPRSTSHILQDVWSPLVPESSQYIDSRPDRQSFNITQLTHANVHCLGSSGLHPLEAQPHSFQPYKCLEPVLPFLENIISSKIACELLEFYFAQPGSSLFRSASPHVLTHVFRKRSILHPTQPRETSSALLSTMLWVSAQTADIPLLLLPGERAKVCDALRKLSMWLIRKRDSDNWDRVSGLVGDYVPCPGKKRTELKTTLEPPGDPPVHLIDDVLTYILISIVISGGDFKADSYTWWSKAVRLAQSMGLNRDDMNCGGSTETCMSPSCACRRTEDLDQSVCRLELQEERRRVFWLLFCLDHHLALSFNSTLNISDEECEVYTPLPEEVWESLEAAPLELLTRRTYGPPTLVTGTGLFEYFLPLMAILGDVIQVHHRRYHPRFGALNDSDAVTLIERLLADCAQSISEVENQYETRGLDGAIPASEFLTPTSECPDEFSNHPPSASRRSQSRAQAQLITAYGTFILHVLHVLLHGKWDAVSMLENKDGWITSVQFMNCASHAIAASEAVFRILRCDPELTFMPYLFGIYLLHGSFILLLFADRMPQLGPNESVEKACETIIRAHEVCVVTLSTEFQKRFRKVLRSALYSVKSAGSINAEESKARRRALSVYRWTKGGRGLAL